MSLFGRVLVLLRPYPRLDLGLVVDLEPKPLVLGLELEAGSEGPRQGQSAPRRSFQRGVSGGGRERGESPRCSPARSVGIEPQSLADAGAGSIPRSPTVWAGLTWGRSTAPDPEPGRPRPDRSAPRAFPTFSSSSFI